MTGNHAKDAWNEVGERFSSWGRLVADHYKEAETTTVDSAREAQHKLEESARELTEQLNRAFTAVGDTLRDPKAKENLKEAVRALGDAVSVTVSETGDEIRKRISRPGPEDGGPEAPPTKGDSTGA
jgi:transcription elongation GreA/GreB family factor